MMQQPSDPMLPAPETGEARLGGLTLVAWVKIGLVGALMLATFRFNLVRLWLKTNPFTGEPNWRHAVCVPLISLYYLYVNRDELLRAGVQPLLWGRFMRPGRLQVSLGILVGGVLLYALGSGAGESTLIIGGLWLAAFGTLVLLLDWGVGITLLGLLLFGYGIWPGQNDFIKDFGMIVALLGVVTLLAGWPAVRVAWFPIAFLLCAIPWPDQVYSRLAWPLQQLAAAVAVGVLRFTGVEAFNTGTKIMIAHAGGKDRVLNVAEACAGLRSLMTFVSVAGAVGFLSHRPFWQKLIITASAVPIAIFCNVMRVSGQGWIDNRWGPEWSENFAHQFVGVVLLVPGFFMILLTGWVLDKIFIEVVAGRPRRDVVVPKQAPAVKWELPRQALIGRAGEDRAQREAAGVKREVSTARPAVVAVPSRTAPARAAAPVAKATPQAVAAPRAAAAPAVARVPRAGAVVAPPAAPVAAQASQRQAPQPQTPQPAQAPQRVAAPSRVAPPAVATEAPAVSKVMKQPPRAAAAPPATGVSLRPSPDPAV